MDDEQDGTIAVMSDGEILESSQETSTALQMLIDDYVMFEGCARKITIGKNEAMALGVTEEEYNGVCESIEWENQNILRMIDECRNNQECKGFVLVDGNRDSIVCMLGDMVSIESLDILNDEAPMLKSVTETTRMPSGTLYASLGSMDEAGCWAPWGMSRVECNVYGEPAWSSHNVTTNFFGKQMTNSHVGNGQFSVGIAASNTSGSVRYMTNAQYGKCTWSGQGS